MQEYVKMIEDHGLTAGSVARDTGYMEFMIDAGFRFISYLVDSAILKNGYEEIHADYKKLVIHKG
jgi:2-keto-3-deoxy-L-rhamnonate aldolase RhmA